MRTTNKTTAPEPQKRGRGRPPKELDIEQVKQLAAIQCTEEEIASVLGISADTIARRKQSDPEFLLAIESGRMQGKASLKRTQFKVAQNGSVPMLIWLGKQYLGQREKLETEMDTTLDKARQIRDALVAMLDVETKQPPKEEDSDQ